MVGLLVGRENTFPQPFIDTVNERGAARNVRAEMAVLGGAREEEEPRYAVIQPASAGRIAPLTFDASSDASHEITAAISSGWAPRTEAPMNGFNCSAPHSLIVVSELRMSILRLMEIINHR